MIKKLLIVVPTHTGQIFAGCTCSLIANINVLNRAGISVSVRTVLYEAYVVRAKNKAIRILQEGDYDALMMIDYDLGFEPYAIAKLIVADRDIVGGAYPFKSGTGFPVAVTGGKDDGGLIRAVSLPGGFTLIKKSVFQEIEKICPIRKDETGLKYFYDTGFLFEDDPRWYGEDKTFFRRVNQCSLNSWLYPDISFEHYGVSEKPGNYDNR